MHILRINKARIGGRVEDRQGALLNPYDFARRYSEFTMSEVKDRLIKRNRLSNSFVILGGFLYI